MVSLFGEFHLFNSYDEEEGLVLFNSEKFVANKKANKNFFFELCDTQNFNYFVQQDCKECFPYFYKLCMSEDKNGLMRLDSNDSININNDLAEENFTIKPFFIDDNLTECSSIEEYLYEKLKGKITYKFI